MQGPHSPISMSVLTKLPGHHYPENIQGSLSMLINLNPLIYICICVFFYSQTTKLGFHEQKWQPLVFFHYFFFLLIAFFALSLALGTRLSNINVIVTDEFNNKLSKNIIVNSLHSLPPTHLHCPGIEQSPFIQVSSENTMASDILHQISLGTTKNIFHSPSDLFSLSNAITGLFTL